MSLSGGKDIEVIHFSTSGIGGAANAAKFLHMNLLKSGISSQFHYLSGNIRETYPYSFRLRRTKLELLKSKLLSLVARKISSGSFFSPFSASLKSIERIAESRNPATTILHFHNWFNISNLKQLSQLRKMGFKIVLTMHDERIYSGGCHYAINCLKFQNSCECCPRVKYFPKLVDWSYLASKKFDFTDTGIFFIAPSQWIFERAKSSRLLSLSKIRMIPNVITIPEQTILEIISNPESESHANINLGVASMNPKDSIKGGDLISRISALQIDAEFSLLYMKDFEDTEAFWASIDYLLVPSIIDNSPNVIHEAKLRGIPVFATRVGGITEMLSDFDVSFGNVDLQGFLIGLNEIRSNLSRIDKSQIRKSFLNYTNNPLEAHLDLYQSVIR